MAHNFGGHPTLMRFIEFSQSVGCSASAYTRVSRSGKASHILKIENSNGGQVLIEDPDYTERLTPSFITYLQRRLGIKTPFASEPE